jgi:hypothetical protein
VKEAADNPMNYLTHVITDVNHPGYVDLKDFDIKSIVAKYPITTYQDKKKKMIDKIQRKYNKAVNLKKA